MVSLLQYDSKLELVRFEYYWIS